MDDMYLTPRERSLAEALVGAGGRVMTTAELLGEAWGWDFADQVRTKTVTMHVSRLRGKLARMGAGPSCIETVRGEGYRYDAGADPGGAAAALCKEADFLYTQ